MDDETEKSIRESKSRVGYSDYSWKEMILFLIGRIILLVILLPIFLLPPLLLHKLEVPFIVISIIVLLEFFVVGWLGIFLNEN